MRYTRRIAGGALVAGWFAMAAAGAEPFAVSARVAEPGDGLRVLNVTFQVQPGHYLYANRISVTSDTEGIALREKRVPLPRQKHDKFANTLEAVYEQTSTFAYTVEGAGPFDVTIGFQGCSETMCFLPASRRFSFGVAAAPRPEPARAEPPGEAPRAAATDWRALAERFSIGGRASGYLGVSRFLAFLDAAESGKAGMQDGLLRLFSERRFWLTLVLIVLGGLGLNLTPCVLPMIPINLAIIGAGAGANSRMRGFLLGAAYGAGIAVAYGLLGVFVVLTGATFGALNASPVFNLFIVVLFVVLALAMFGVFNLDFSRFQGKLGTGKSRRGSLPLAFAMGAVVALLAGACVAPAVISVLILATNLHSAGNPAGLLLPFLLGFGMALPWPFAGAGLSFLPKPGKWMEKVKYAFGLLILAFAVYYGRLAVLGIRARAGADPAAVAAVQPAATGDGWLASLPEALRRADAEQRPVFVDFWASWCKSCLHMDKTTFRDARVKERLAQYVTVKYRAEDPEEPGTKAVLDYFLEAPGLPAYVLLLPQQHKSEVGSRKPEGN